MRPQVTLGLCITDNGDTAFSTTNDAILSITWALDSEYIHSTYILPFSHPVSPALLLCTVYVIAFCLPALRLTYRYHTDPGNLALTVITGRQHALNPIHPRRTFNT